MTTQCVVKGCTATIDESKSDPLESGWWRVTGGEMEPVFPDGWYCPPHADHDDKGPLAEMRHLAAPPIRVDIPRDSLLAQVILQCAGGLKTPEADPEF